MFEKCSAASPNRKMEDFPAPQAGVELIGPKIEALYLAFVPADASGPDLYKVAECLQAVEEHVAATAHGEDAVVVAEIVQDCRRKAAPLLRMPYTEGLRVVMTATRKKLIAKIGRSEPVDGNTTYSHGERHFHLLMELLGGWSNSMYSISELGEYL